MNDGFRSAKWVDFAQGALNGAIGDYLKQRGNGLAFGMEFFHRGAPLPLDPAALRKAHPSASGRVLVLLHGVASTEGIWAFPGDATLDYGVLAARDLGVTPLYVRYNSGLAIAESGAAFATLMAGLVAAYPREVESIDLVGHSMGGLVVRSACAEGEALGHGWLRAVRRAVYLGSPHLGAPLEKFAHIARRVLGRVPDPTTKLVGQIMDLRSVGVKDLRHGLAAEVPLPLTAGIEHFAIAGTLTADERHLLARLVGDALVRVPSAHGVPSHLSVVPGVDHVGLAHHPAVYERLRALLTVPT